MQILVGEKAGKTKLKAQDMSVIHWSPHFKVLWDFIWLRAFAVCTEIKLETYYIFSITYFFWERKVLRNCNMYSTWAGKNPGKLHYVLRYNYGKIKKLFRVVPVELDLTLQIFSSKMQCIWSITLKIWVSFATSGFSDVRCVLTR